MNSPDNLNQMCNIPNNNTNNVPNNNFNNIPNNNPNNVPNNSNIINTHDQNIVKNPIKTEDDIIKFVNKDKFSNIYSIFNNDNKINNISSTSDDKNYIIYFLITIKNIVKYLITCIDLKPIFFKFINIDRIFHFALLMTIKYYLQENCIALYSMIFRDKISCLVFNKTLYTSTYLMMNNNENNSIPIKALLKYCTDNKIPCVKYITDQSGEIVEFDTNSEIRLEKNIYLSVQTSNLNNGVSYKIEICSYSKNIEFLQKFIHKCSLNYKNMPSNHSSTGELKYYTYYNFNNQNMCPVYEDNKFISNKNFSNIFHPKKDFFIKKVNNFVNGKAIYRALGMPYFLGIILYGDPGTGKTSFIKALAKETSRNIVEIPFSKIKSFKELKSIFSSDKINGNIVPNKKRLYVIEEFDCVIDSFKKRELTNNIQPQNNQLQNNNVDSPLTLDNLLAIIDGTCEPSDYIICITTNFINKIDPALIRPGRFDIRLEFKYAVTSTIMEIIFHFSQCKKKCDNIKLFFQDYDYYYKLINKYTYYKSKLLWSPATVCQICLLLIDEDNYLDKVIKHLIDNYKSKCDEVQ